MYAQSELPKYSDRESRTKFLSEWRSWQLTSRLELKRQSKHLSWTKTICKWICIYNIVKRWWNLGMSDVTSYGDYLRMPMATSMRTLLIQAQIRQPTKSAVIKTLNHTGNMMTSLSATYPSSPRASTISLMLTSDNSQIFIVTQSYYLKNEWRE